MPLNRKGIRASRLAIAAVLIAAVALTGCGKKNAADQKVVATYKGGQVTQTELDKYMNTTKFFYPQYGYLDQSQELKESMLKQLTTLKIMSDRATDESRKEAADETKKQMKQMEDYFKTQGDLFDKQLKTLGITKSDIEAYMNRNFIISKDLDKKVKEDEIKTSYDEKLKADPHVFDVVSVAHILISLNDPADNTKALRTKEEALKRAQEVEVKLNAGQDFAAMAKTYSDDPGSKDNGGKYENQRLSTSAWDPAFKKAALDQPVGQIGQPFESSFGYHIMRVDKRETQSLDQMKDELRGELASKMMTDFMENELPKLDYKTNLPAPSASTAPSVSPSASPAAK